jgi:hypothetical protein
MAPQFALFFTLIATAIVSSCGSSPSSSSILSDAMRRVEEKDISLCVQTFNAYGPAYAPNVSGRTKAWGSELAASPCAVIQAQEIWSEQHYDQATIALRQGLPWMSAVHFDRRQNPYVGTAGLALFTDHTIVETSFEPFSVNQDGILDNIRTALGVIKGMGSSHLKLRHVNDEMFLVNLHTHPSSKVVRIAQMTELLDQFDRMLPLRHPLIVSGDFNFEPDSIEYSMLRDILQLQDSYVSARGPYRGDECTYCKENPHHWGGGDRVIDYIWFRNSESKTLEANASWINLNGSFGPAPSDHYGLRTLFSLRSSSPQMVDDKTFEHRRTKAMLAINAALPLLTARQSDESGIQLAVTILANLHRRLLNADRTDHFVEQLRVP